MRKQRHMIHMVLLVLGVVVLTCCRPKDILSPRQLEDLLFDMHTAEGILQESGYNYGHDEEYRGYSLVVLKQHGTTQAQFDSTLMWYTAHPTIFDKIYPKVLERLQAQHDAYDRLLKLYNKRMLRTVDDWLYFCQHGYKIHLIPEKSKKSEEKFAYVKKM